MISIPIGATFDFLQKDCHVLLGLFLNRFRYARCQNEEKLSSFQVLYAFWHTICILWCTNAFTYAALFFGSLYMLFNVTKWGTILLLGKSDWNGIKALYLSSKLSTAILVNLIDVEHVIKDNTLYFCCFQRWASFYFVNIADKRSKIIFTY